MPVIKFVKEKKEIEVPVGANLRKEAMKAGINVNCIMSGICDEIDSVVQTASKFLNCHGLGACGTCRVRITSGIENTNPFTLREKARLSAPVPLGPDPVPNLAYLGNEQTMRLACMTKVMGDMTVESAPEMNLYGENFFS